MHLDLTDPGLAEEVRELIHSLGHTAAIAETAVTFTPPDKVFQRRTDANARIDTAAAPSTARSRRSARCPRCRCAAWRWTTPTTSTSPAAP
ncbi:hypothetical protein GCM10020001_045700 [Nonomuraea salmonea]